MLSRTAEPFMGHVTAEVGVVANIFAAVMSCGHKNTDGAHKDRRIKQTRADMLDAFLLKNQKSTTAWTSVYYRVCLLFLNYAN